MVRKELRENARQRAAEKRSVAIFQGSLRPFGINQPFRRKMSLTLFFGSLLDFSPSGDRKEVAVL
jgi:hypothetical protein